MMLPKSKPPRSEKYRRWIASQPCLICASPETQAAHTERGGRGMKGSDYSCVPLCLRHHDELDGRRKVAGRYGREAFESHYGIDLAAHVERLNEEYGI